MKKLIVFTVSFLLVLCTASFSEAILIGSANTTHSGGSEGVFSSIDLDAKYSYTTLNPVIFDSLIVSTTDIGTEFFATSSTGFSPDPGFDDFASNITDGIDQLLSFGLTGNYESLLFSTSPDFQGYTIDAFGLKINGLG